MTPQRRTILKALVERMRDEQDPAETAILATGFRFSVSHQEVLDLINEVEALTARNSALEEGLRPFAKVGDLFERTVLSPVYEACLYGPAAGREFNITETHVRQAAALLKPATTAAKEE